ncbi:MAG: SMC-Scp complex subunit ScpB [Clostridia bacterium]|nr:SMC-Scp complex subunit ScpB [Clostridia bacterium]
MIVDEKRGAIECILFVAGEPVEIDALKNALSLTQVEIQAILDDMDRQYRSEARGILLSVTDTTVQLVSNRKYAYIIEQMLQPPKEKSFSQSLLETLSVIAYKQPVTRSEIEAVRGVRCDYSVSRLEELGFIKETGRKDTVGRPVQFSTTDKFLREFGINSISQLPELKLPNEDE